MRCDTGVREDHTVLHEVRYRTVMTVDAGCVENGYKAARRMIRNRDRDHTERRRRLGQGSWDVARLCAGRWYRVAVRTLRVFDESEGGDAGVFGEADALARGLRRYAGDGEVGEGTAAVCGRWGGWTRGLRRYAGDGEVGRDISGDWGGGL